MGPLDRWSASVRGGPWVAEAKRLTRARARQRCDGRKLVARGGIERRDVGDLTEGFTGRFDSGLMPAAMYRGGSNFLSWTTH
jgi:hypothetical protein